MMIRGVLIVLLAAALPGCTTRANFDNLGPGVGHILGQP